eukprot:4456118-Prymnesium_polylepis.1
MAMPCAKLQQSGLVSLSLSMRSCAEFTDDAARLLASSLPASLEEVRLELVGSSATNAGGRGGCSKASWGTSARTCACSNSTIVCSPVPCRSRLGCAWRLTT